MRNDEVLQLVKNVNDIALGAPIDEPSLNSLRQWVRLEEEHGSSPAVTAVIKALIRELAEARDALSEGGQQTVVTEAAEPKKARAKREVDAEETPKEDAPAEDGAKQEVPVEAEGETPVSSTEEW